LGTSRRYDSIMPNLRRTSVAAQKLRQVFNFTDNFGARANGALGGTRPPGNRGWWTNYRNSFTIVSGRANAPTPASGDYTVSAVVTDRADKTITATTVDAGAGISFWVTDANNWWGATHQETQTCQTCQGCSSSSPVYWYRCTAFEYSGGGTSWCCGCGGPPCNLGACAGPCGPCCYCSTIGPQSSGPCTYCTNWASNITGYTCNAYFNYSCNCTTNYFLRLIRSVANTVTQVAQQATTSNAAIANVRVVTSGQNITATAQNSSGTDIATITDTSTGKTTANAHGILLSRTDFGQGNNITQINVQ
jgi:hypothetical protein